MDPRRSLPSQRAEARIPAFAGMTKGRSVAGEVVEGLGDGKENKMLK